jgi:CBS-domain-containing membrane protein
MNATDVMVSNVVTVNVDATVQEVASTLATNRISAVPVLDRHGKLAGIVSEGDLIRRSEIGTEKSRSWWLDAPSTIWRLAEEFVRSHSRRVSDAKLPRCSKRTESSACPSSRMTWSWAS